MTKYYLLLAVMALTSCRCQINYKPILASLASSDTTITATAMMWQGQYDYLEIKIEVNRFDSLFVKNILVNPSLPNDEFYPSFSHILMFSYFYGDTNSIGDKGQYKAGYYWQDYYAHTFDELPTDNRQTNKGKSLVSYSLNYRSEKSINFEKFSAYIEVLLVDKDGKMITRNRHFDFRGKKDCRFSVH